MTTTKDTLGIDQVSIGQSFELAVASGETPNITYEKIHGRNNDIGTTIEDVWVAGGIMSWQQTASVISIVSNSAQDANTTTATGTRKIKIEGLLAGFTAATEIVNLNGTSTVTTSNAFIRMNRAYAHEVGTYDGTTTPLHGTVTLTHGSTVCGVLFVDGSVTCSETQLAKYTVPAGYDAYLSEIHTAVGANKDATIYFFKRENADVVTAPFTARKIVAIFDGLTGSNVMDLHGYRLPEKTDFWLAAKGSAVNTSIATIFDIILKRRA